MLIGRSLTSRLVLTITAMTLLSALIVSAASGWMTYKIIHAPITSEVGSFRSIALSGLLFALVAICISSVAGWQIGRAMTRPVLRMAGTMRRMAEGDLSVQPPPTTPGTELGHMAYALELFRVNARERLAAEAGRQAAEQIARERSEFLATMSHEIRTPMNGVLGMAQALASSPLNKSQRAMLEVLTNSGDALLQLLNDVLDLSAIEAGRLSLNAEPFDICDALQSTASTFLGSAEKKGLALTVHRPDADVTVIGDRERVSQIVANLLSNAVKFTDRGSVEAKLSAEPEGPNAYAIRIDVCDTGIGIEQSARERLFQKFVQADASTTRAYGGTGLGLAMSRQLARLMGGDIDFVSVEGEGSTFTLRLTLSSVGAAQPTTVAVSAVESDQRNEAEQNQSLRVLVAEDSPANQQVLQVVLNNIGADVTFAADGKQTVEVFEKHAFDIVLMDLQMPVMSGFEAARRIRKLERTRGGRTPIVAVSANNSAEDVSLCMSVGMDGHVSKPVSPANLFHAMERAIILNEALALQTAVA